MTAFTFVLTALDTGSLVGAAVVCPDARYASVLWRGEQRLDRRFVPATAWTRIVGELEAGWPGGLLERQSATASALTAGRDASIAVQCLSQEPVIAQPMDVAAKLDARLGQVRV